MCSYLLLYWTFSVIEVNKKIVVLSLTCSVIRQPSSGSRVVQRLFWGRSSVFLCNQRHGKMRRDSMKRTCRVGSAGEFKLYFVLEKETRGSCTPLARYKRFPRRFPLWQQTNYPAMTANSLSCRLRRGIRRLCAVVNSQAAQSFRHHQTSKKRNTPWRHKYKKQSWKYYCFNTIKKKQGEG